MVAIAGIGTRAAALAALALVVGHALFKSTLFLTVGVIDKSTGTRDLRVLSGVCKRLLPISIPASLAALSMAGVTPLAGFVAKESALEALWGGARAPSRSRLPLAGPPCRRSSPVRADRRLIRQLPLDDPDRPGLERPRPAMHLGCGSRRGAVGGPRRWGSSPGLRR